MALGDGSAWNETAPDDSSLAKDIDDYNRDLRVGVRDRLDKEHIWPSSQTAASQAGHHKFVSFQAETAAPTLVAASGQVGALYVSTAAGNPLMYENSGGTSVMLVGSGAKMSVISGGTQGAIVVCSSANATTLVVLAASADGLFLRSQGATAAPKWDDPLTAHFAVGSGVVAHGATVPLLAGYASSQVTCFVSVSSFVSTYKDIFDIYCSVDANRLVTCSGRSLNWVDGDTYQSITGTANYLIIGTK